MFTDISLVGLATLFIFPAAMAFAAASDLFTMRISNKVSLMMVAGFAILAPFAGFDWAMAGNHVAVAALVLVVGFACFSFGWMGGADAKIAASTALWFGWYHTFEYLLIAALLGGALTFGILILRRTPLPAAMNNVDWIARLHNASNGVPYGIALATSALVVYPGTVWMTGAIG